MSTIFSQEQSDERDSLIDRQPTSEKGSFLRALKMASLVFGVTDKLHVAAIKAVSSDPGLPRRKHVDVLLEHTVADPMRLENILLAFNAATNWLKNRVISCKIMAVLLSLLRGGVVIEERVATGAAQTFLHMIHTHWETRGDVFIPQLALFMQQRLILAAQCPHLNGFLTSPASKSTDSLTLGIDAADLLAATSRMLSCSDALLAALRIAARAHAGESSLEREIIDSAAEETIVAAEPVMWAEAASMNKVLGAVLLQMHQRGIASEVLPVMREQFNAQFSGLVRVYEALLQQQQQQQHHHDLLSPPANPFAPS